MSNETPITDDWLVSSGFHWRQDERQPNKHWMLGLNFKDGLSGLVQTTIELQREGWMGRGGYVGNPNRWMLWLKDRFNTRACIGSVHHQGDVMALAGNQQSPEWSGSCEGGPYNEMGQPFSSRQGRPAWSNRYRR